MTTPCQLGAYEVRLVNGGVTLPVGRSTLERIEYGRVLDGVSRGSATFAVPGIDCCGQLAAADHDKTDLVIIEDKEEIWRGPARRVRYRRGRVIVEANDVTSWLGRRIMPEDLVFDDEDVVDIAEAIWESAVASVDAPIYEIVKFTSGVRESRRVKASDYRYARAEIQEMLDAGLDITAFGRRIILGMPAFTPIDLTDLDVEGDVEVVKDGDEYAGRIIADANASTTAIYPPGPRKGSNGYPLVEARLYDPGLEDQSSADNAAKARYDFSSNGVRRVRAQNGLILLPNSRIDHRRLIAGQLVNFTATETCYTATETLRLGSLTCVVEGGEERVTIDLQPLGAVNGLEDVGV